jgi:hypothetical protein
VAGDEWAHYVAALGGAASEDEGDWTAGARGELVDGRADAGAEAGAELAGDEVGRECGGCCCEEGKRGGEFHGCG